MNKSKLISLLSFIGIGLVVAMFFIWQSMPTTDQIPQPDTTSLSQSPPNKPQNIKVDTKIFFPNQLEPTEFSAVTRADGTALQLLKDLAAQNKLELSIKEYDFGSLVEKIGSFSQDEQNAWIFYTNGVVSSVGATDYQLNDGDIIEWKYESIW